MLIYDFRCAGCGHAFEAFVRSAAEAPACPSCSSQSVARTPATPFGVGHTRGGRVVDLSSNLCRCGCAARRLARR